MCDLCAQYGDEAPPCVESAPKGVLQWIDADDPALEDSDVHVLTERFAVRCRKWERQVAGGAEK
jgi:Fe-S-cluster-containing dehydrogenase component